MKSILQMPSTPFAHPHPVVLAALIILGITAWAAYQVVRRCIRENCIRTNQGSVLPMTLLSLAGFTAAFVSLWGMGRVREPLIVHLVIEYPLDLFLCIFGLTLYSFAERRLVTTGPGGTNEESE